MPVHSKRIGWLRATVLGANDGILSTSSLVLGVAATHATQCNILVAGVGGLVAGAMSSHGGDCRHRVAVRNYCLTLKIHDFRNTEGLAMVQIRYRGGFETKSEAFT